MTRSSAKLYPDSPPPIESLADLVKVALAARNGDYESSKRLKAIERGMEQHRQEVILTTYLRKVNQIETELGNVRQAIGAGDAAAEHEANARIAAILDIMSEADQQRAWDRILKWDFCGNIEFIIEYYRGKSA